jgi:hypothetical protein
MGQLDDMGLDRKDETKAKRRKRERRMPSRARAFDFEGLDTGVLWWCLQRVWAKGGALRLGLSRDGGAFALGIYGDGGDPYTEYFRDGLELTEYLRELGTTFEDWLVGQ